MEITLTVPEELGQRLQPMANDLTRILELGVRAWSARGEPGYAGLADVLEMLASLPTPEEVLALRPGPALQGRIETLLEKSQAGGLSAEEQHEWEQFQRLSGKFGRHKLAKENSFRHQEAEVCAWPVRPRGSPTRPT
jgi:hypothetical protein